MAGSLPNFHKMDSRSASIQDVLKVKVKVKGHVIWALLCWHENRFFSQANGRIATKLAHDGLQVSLHPRCAQGQGQGQGQGQRSRDTHTFLDSWNELLRHWRSGFLNASLKRHYRRIKLENYLTTSNDEKFVIFVYGTDLSCGVQTLFKQMPTTIKLKANMKRLRVKSRWKWP